MALVTHDDLERALAGVRAQVADPVVGLFGPSSPVWTINRRTIVFLGAARAALLQLAHPWVARAIEQHSNTLSDPIGRFHRTFVNVFAMVYGDLDLACSAALRVHGVHRRIRGVLPDGEAYTAEDVDALMWVHATLWETSVLIYERVRGPLSRVELDAYYADTCRFAALFGIPPSALPPDWGAFKQYNREMWSSGRLVVIPAARQIGDFLFEPLAPGMGPVMRWYRRVTAGLLPPEMRAGFGLEFDDVRDRPSLGRALAVARAYDRITPRRLRYLPPYIDACRRIAGKPTPDLLGRMLNRALVGTTKLV